MLNMKKLTYTFCAFVLALTVLVSCDNPNPVDQTPFSNTTWKRTITNNVDSPVFTMYVKFGPGSNGVYTAIAVNEAETVIPDNFAYSVVNDTIRFVHEKYAYFHYYRWRLDHAFMKEDLGRQVFVVGYQYYKDGQWIMRLEEFEQEK